MSEPDVTLLNCDQEPIHIPDAIQPCGYFLGLEIPSLTVGVASDNCSILFDRPIGEIVSQSIDNLLSSENIQLLRSHADALQGDDVETAFALSLGTPEQPMTFDARLRLTEHSLLLELDNGRGDNVRVGQVSIDLLSIQGLLSRLGRQETVVELADAVAREVKAITGFDRVMVYRFHPDLHGEVIAESVKEGWEPYLGLHYPESDIPAQARKLYCRNHVRCIISSDYEAVALTASRSSKIPMPFDMSDSHLRSVSPIHLQYLRNMGVGASMSISLMDNDQLWGLIACHHGSERFVSYHVRKACELLGTTFSLMLLQLEEAEQARELVRLQDIERQLLGFMVNSVPFVDGAFRHLPNLSSLVNADGAASIAGDVLSVVGETPSEEQIIAFADWLKQNDSNDVLVSHQIGKEYPLAYEWENDIRGVLVIEIARGRRQFLFCFLKQVINTISWAGRPEKIVQRVDGVDRLAPRESFSEWAETVYDQSRHWTRTEVTVAETMRRAILHLIVDWTEEVASLNQLLKTSNNDLQIFAEVAAHDLKEPLRGIENYVSFFIQDHQNQLDDEMRRKLDVMNALASRGNELTNSLLSFAEISNSPLERRMQSMDRLFDQALESLSSRFNEKTVDIRRPEQLPDAWVDDVLMVQVLQNLLGNAIKYASEDPLVIEFGVIKPELNQQAIEHLKRNHAKDIFYVKDNGIGIPNEYLEDIFQLFKRVHPRSKYGDGNGIGLSIAQRIIDHHKGRLWAESEVGKGTCLFFFISAQPDTVVSNQ